jgi:hypothetical protein
LFGRSGCMRGTWSAVRIDISILFISLKSGSARQGTLESLQYNLVGCVVIFLCVRREVRFLI